MGMARSKMRTASMGQLTMYHPAVRVGGVVPWIVTVRGAAVPPFMKRRMDPSDRQVPAIGGFAARRHPRWREVFRQLLALPLGLAASRHPGRLTTDLSSGAGPEIHGVTLLPKTDLSEAVHHDVACITFPLLGLVLAEQRHLSELARRIFDLDPQGHSGDGPISGVTSGGIAPATHWSGGS